MQVRTPHRLPRRSPIIAALALLANCGAHADEPSPWYIGATETIRHDSNVNRYGDGFSDPKGRGNGDTYSSTGLVGGFDQSYGRQHFYGSGTVAYNKYHAYDELNNTSYGLQAGWDWATVNNFSGGVNASANQSLAQLNGNAGPVTSSARNLLRTEQIGTNVNWGGAGALSVQGAYTHSRVSYANPSQLGSNSSGDSASLGTYYRLGPTLTTGIAYRITRTTNPDVFDSTGTLVTAENTSNGRNIDLSADWRYSAQTGVNARLSFTHQTNAGGGSQDFSGLTGSISANYAPTGKLAFTAAYARDAGTNGTLFNVPITSGSTTTGTTSTYATSVYQNTTIANTLSAGVTYAATAKIGVNANYSYRNARTTATSASDYDDKLQTAGLGVSWAIARAWTLGCNYTHEARDAQSVPVYKYSANVFGCSAQVTLR